MFIFAFSKYSFSSKAKSWNISNAFNLESSIKSSFVNSFIFAIGKTLLALFNCNSNFAAYDSLNLFASKLPSFNNW